MIDGDLVKAILTNNITIIPPVFRGKSVSCRCRGHFGAVFHLLHT